MRVPTTTSFFANALLLLLLAAAAAPAAAVVLIARRRSATTIRVVALPRSVMFARRQGKSQARMSRRPLCVGATKRAAWKGRRRVGARVVPAAQGVATAHSASLGAASPITPPDGEGGAGHGA